MGRLLSTTDLEHMKAHKYQTTGYTWLDNQLNPFWTKCASLLPYKISPNMVTVIGFLCQSLGMVLISLYDLTLSKPISSWIYFACAFLMFCGQTFDAIDGKHARNTQRSSSLGQLMDHGCDAMGTYFFVIMLCQSHCFGSSFNTFLLQVLLQTGFYLFTLEEHFSGILRTNYGYIGVTEYQFLAMALVIIPAFVGQTLGEIVIFGMTIKALILWITTMVSLIYCIKLIHSTSKDLKDGWDKWKYMLMFFLFGTTEYMSSKLMMFKAAPFIIVAINGNYFGLMASKLIIRTMAKKDLPMVDEDIVIYFAFVVVMTVVGNWMVEMVIFTGLTLWVLQRFYTVIIGVIKEMLDFLNISF